MLSFSVALFWSLFRHEHRWLDVTETRADSVRVIDRQCARCGLLATD